MSEVDKSGNCAIILDDVEKTIIAAVEKRYGFEIHTGQVTFFIENRRVDHVNKLSQIKIAKH